MASLPKSGTLESAPLPQLLLALSEQGYSGGLSLSHAKSNVEITIDQGFPIVIESSTSSFGIGARLKNQGKINAADYDRVRELCESKGYKEEKALLELKLLPPKNLAESLRDHMQALLVDCFSWPGGEYKLDTSRKPADNAKPFRIDMLPLVFDGLAAHWRPEQILPLLGSRLDRYAVLTSRKEKLTQRLSLDDDLIEYLELFDGATTLGSGLQQASSMSALPLLLAYDLAGGFEYFDEMQYLESDETEGEESAGEEDDSLQSVSDLELVVDGRVINKDGTEPKAKAKDAPKDSKPKSKKKSEPNAPIDEFEKLRKNVLTKHEQLDSIDFYTLLNVTREDDASAVKKAYFKLAKIFHPDVLSKHGLGDILKEAGEVFSRIAEAHTILSDPKKRQEYDEALASGNAHHITDADRLANAENLFRKGEVLFKMGQFERAAQFFKPAVELWPEETEYQSMLGSCLYRKNPPEDEQARAHLEKAVELDPKNAQAHYWLSIVLKALGENEASAKSRADAEKLDPKLKK